MWHPQIISWRAYLVSFSIGLVFLLILGRLFCLQVIPSEEYRQTVNATRNRTVLLKARRGDILDRRGNVLAGTRPVYRIGIDPSSFNPEDDSSLSALAELIQRPVKWVEDRAYDRFRTVITEGKKQKKLVRWRKLADAVDQDTYHDIQELKISGVYGNLYFERYYPSGTAAAHVIGYLNKENTPVMGIERLADFYLSGQDGFRRTERDGRRRELVQYRSEEIQPSDGWSVHLTIDLRVQDIVEEEIRRIAEAFNPEGVSIIVSDPSTGHILGLANYPTFDPNAFWDFPISSQRNRSVTDRYEPGSTFKIIPVSAALNEGIINRDTSIDCSKTHVDYQGRSIKLPNDDHKLGIIQIPQLVSKSSNRGAAQLGIMLGEERLYRYCRGFGIGEKSNSIFSQPGGGEIKGTLHSPEHWDGLTISRLPAGYAVSTTPMQIHFAMSTIANRGHLMTPRLIDYVEQADKDSRIDFMPIERRQVIRSGVARQVASMLHGVVKPGGTARKADIPGFEVCGKTGTARKIIDGKYSHSHHVGSFSGFFPASDPQVVITVVVDDAKLKGIAYGGTVAAPSFRRIGERIIQQFAMKPPQKNKTHLAKNIH